MSVPPPLEYSNPEPSASWSIENPGSKIRENPDLPGWKDLSANSAIQERVDLARSGDPKTRSVRQEISTVVPGNLATPRPLVREVSRGSPREVVSVERKRSSKALRYNTYDTINFLEDANENSYTVDDWEPRDQKKITFYLNSLI